MQASTAVGSTQGTPAGTCTTGDGPDGPDDPHVLHVLQADNTGGWSTLKCITLDDVRARLQVLEERKKQRENAGLVTPAGMQFAKTLINELKIKVWSCDITSAGDTAQSEAQAESQPDPDPSRGSTIK